MEFLKIALAGLSVGNQRAGSKDPALALDANYYVLRAVTVNDGEIIRIIEV